MFGKGDIYNIFPTSFKEEYLETFFKYIKYIDKERNISQKEFSDGYFSFLKNNYKERKNNISNYKSILSSKNLEKAFAKAKEKGIIKDYDLNISNCGCSPWEVKVYAI